MKSLLSKFSRKKRHAEPVPSASSSNRGFRYPQEPQIAPTPRVQRGFGLSYQDLQTLQKGAMECKPLKQVLETAELLEAILLCLDMRTLLISAQQVNHHWHELVQTSPALQTALFFRPDNTESLDMPSPAINPLLAEYFPPWFQNGGNGDGEGQPNQRDSSDGSKVPMFQEYGKEPFGKRIEAFMRNNASWRRMLVHNYPPAYVVNMWTSCRGMGLVEYSMEYKYTNGLQMGQLYDLSIDCCRMDYNVVLFRPPRISGFMPTETEHNQNRVVQGTADKRQEAAAQSDIVLYLRRSRGWCGTDYYEIERCEFFGVFSWFGFLGRANRKADMEDAVESEFWNETARDPHGSGGLN